MQVVLHVEIFKNVNYNVQGGDFLSINLIYKLTNKQNVLVAVTIYVKLMVVKVTTSMNKQIEVQVVIMKLHFISNLVNFEHEIINELHEVLPKLKQLKELN